MRSKEPPQPMATSKQPRRTHLCPPDSKSTRYVLSAGSYRATRPVWPALPTMVAARRVPPSPPPTATAARLWAKGGGGRASVPQHTPWKGPTKSRNKTAWWGRPPTHHHPLVVPGSEEGGRPRNQELGRGIAISLGQKALCFDENFARLCQNGALRRGAATTHWEEDCHQRQSDYWRTLLPPRKELLRIGRHGKPPPPPCPAILRLGGGGALDF